MALPFSKANVRPGIESILRKPQVSVACEIYGLAPPKLAFQIFPPHPQISRARQAAILHIYNAVFYSAHFNSDRASFLRKSTLDNSFASHESQRRLNLCAHNKGIVWMWILGAYCFIANMKLKEDVLAQQVATFGSSQLLSTAVRTIFV